MSFQYINCLANAFRKRQTHQSRILYDRKTFICNKSNAYRISQIFCPHQCIQTGSNENIQQCHAFSAQPFPTCSAFQCTPFSDFGLFPNTAGRRIPPVNQSIAINKSNVCRNLSQPPKHTARVLPARPINVIILYFIVFTSLFLKNGYKKNGRWGNANRSLHNQLYSSLTLFLSNNHNITFVPVYRYLFAI